MTWETAFRLAYKQAKYHQTKRYVWAYRSARTGDIYYTVTGTPCTEVFK